MTQLTAQNLTSHGSRTRPRPENHPSSWIQLITAWLIIRQLIISQIIISQLIISQLIIRQLIMEQTIQHVLSIDG